MTKEDFIQIVKSTMLDLLDKYREINPGASAIDAYAHDLDDVCCYQIQVLGVTHENDLLYSAQYEPKAEGKA